MKITVNKKDTVLEAPELTVRQLLSELRYIFPMIYVRINGQVVKKDQWDTRVVREGDKVDAIHLMGGG
jgi:thiamine biosynthesis protein ThiS